MSAWSSWTGNKENFDPDNLMAIKRSELVGLIRITEVTNNKDLTKAGVYIEMIKERIRNGIKSWRISAPGRSWSSISKSWRPSSLRRFKKYELVTYTEEDGSLQKLTEQTSTNWRRSWNDERIRRQKRIYAAFWGIQGKDWRDHQDHRQAGDAYWCPGQELRGKEEGRKDREDQWTVRFEKISGVAEDLPDLW